MWVRDSSINNYITTLQVFSSPHWHKVCWQLPLVAGSPWGWSRGGRSRAWCHPPWSQRPGCASLPSPRSRYSRCGLGWWTWSCSSPGLHHGGLVAKQRLMGKLNLIGPLLYSSHTPGLTNEKLPTGTDWTERTLELSGQSRDIFFGDLPCCYLLTFFFFTLQLV